MNNKVIIKTLPGFVIVISAQYIVAVINWIINHTWMNTQLWFTIWNLVNFSAFILSTGLLKSKRTEKQGLKFCLFFCLISPFISVLAFAFIVHKL